MFNPLEFKKEQQYGNRFQGLPPSYQEDMTNWEGDLDSAAQSISEGGTGGYPMYNKNIFDLTADVADKEDVLGRWRAGMRGGGHPLSKPGDKGWGEPEELPPWMQNQRDPRNEYYDPEADNPENLLFGGMQGFGGLSGLLKFAGQQGGELPPWMQNRWNQPEPKFNIPQVEDDMYGGNEGGWGGGSSGSNPYSEPNFSRPPEGY